MERIRKICCVPAFVMSFAGPHMMISGAVSVDKIILQPLTDFVYLGGRDVDQRIYHIATIFHALNSSLDMLSAIGPRVDHLLPYTTSFDASGTVHHIRYIGMLCSLSESKAVDPTRAIFEAYRLSDDRRLVVKFV